MRLRRTVCVPFMVTNKGDGKVWGIVWDNPARTLVWPGLHGSTHFQSNVGERVSFFVITGKTSDDLYAGYAKLTGATPLPPKAAFGLIQSRRVTRRRRNCSTLRRAIASASCRST
jgi:alpha-D-xyloside xylohydrolase